MSTEVVTADSIRHEIKIARIMQEFHAGAGNKENVMAWWHHAQRLELLLSLESVSVEIPRKRLKESK